jgi:hypothetical protein
VLQEVNEAERRPETCVSSRLVNAESVVLVPRCTECEADWLPADGERWRAYLTDDEPPELAFYCRQCGEREFGGDEHAS